MYRLSYAFTLVAAWDSMEGTSWGRSRRMVRSFRRRMAQTCSVDSPCLAPEKCGDRDECERSEKSRDDVLTTSCENKTDMPLPLVDEDAIIKAADANSPDGPIPITQADFSSGSMTINKSGHYKFEEDIVIPRVYRPLVYTSPKHVGQTIGIYVVADDVVIDLNGHSLEMSTELRKHEVFMTLIQLNTNNFANGSIGFGPMHNASRVLIYSSGDRGTLKLSTHFGISGMSNKDIIIRDLDLIDCEVGGISITDSENIHIENVLVDNTNLVAPFTDFYGVLIQLRRRLDQIISIVGKNETSIGNNETSSNNGTSIGNNESSTGNNETSIGNNETSIGNNETSSDNETQPDTIDTWKQRRDEVDAQIEGADTNWLANPEPDRTMGNSFGIQIKNLNREVKYGGRNIRIMKTTVKNIRSGTRNVQLILTREGPLRDADWNVFSWHEFIENDGTLKNCTLSDPRCAMNTMRIVVAKFLCSLKEEERPPGVLCMKTLAILKSGIPRSTDLPDSIVGNFTKIAPSDIRTHDAKGAFGLRFVGVTGAVVEDVKVIGVNSTETGKKFVQPVADIRTVPIVWPYMVEGENIFALGHCAFGFSIRTSKYITVKKTTVQNISSTHGVAAGFVATKNTSFIEWDHLSAHVVTPTPGDKAALPNVSFNMPFYIGENTFECLVVGKLEILAKANGDLPGGNAAKTLTVLAIAIAVVVLLVLAALAYYCAKKDKTVKPRPPSSEKPNTRAIE